MVSVEWPGKQGFVQIIENQWFYPKTFRFQLSPGIGALANVRASLYFC
jgi:hypothetical protein